MPVSPYKDQKSSKKEQVASMFNNIAHRYDFLNQLLSFGIHKGWRRKAIASLTGKKPKLILDIASGTGDFALAAIKLKPEHIIGIDISEGMLKLGQEKIKKLGLENIIQLQYGDSEHLPFEKNYFDAVIVAFGVRNFENLSIGIAETYRVLKPGGRLVVLEFSKPRGVIIKKFYSLYNRFITPQVGKFFSKDSSAYSYLPESVAAFPDGGDFLSVLSHEGFINTTFQELSFGIATIYCGDK